MKKIIFSALIIIVLAFVVYYLFANKQYDSKNPTVQNSTSSTMGLIDLPPTVCLTSDEIEKNSFSINTSGTYVGILGYREGVVFIAIRDRQSCKNLFSASRSGNEFRDIKWEGSVFKFTIIAERRPLREFIGEVNSLDWMIKWADHL